MKESMMKKLFENFTLSGPNEGKKTEKKRLTEFESHIEKSVASRDQRNNATEGMLHLANGSKTDV